MQSEQSKVDVVAQPVFTDKTATDEAISASQDIRDAAEKEAMEISMVGDAKAKIVVESQVDEPVGDKKLQKAIDRLQARVQSMVGKIETQLTDVEIKIGDKFHLLDKDGDGVLTMEEMAQVLQTVLKRELTAEEAIAIAEDMDTNKDGVFSIAELAQWAETNTIVKLAEDGREKDLNEMISKRVADLNAKLKMAMK
jgi:Ca2+-binding EF-hand superfamily protein